VAKISLAASWMAGNGMRCLTSVSQQAIDDLELFIILHAPNALERERHLQTLRDLQQEIIEATLPEISPDCDDCEYKQYARSAPW
jgi:hypothetical protein